MKTAMPFRFANINFLCVIETQLSIYKSKKSDI